MSLWTNLKKRGLKDILKPGKWIMYIRYWYYRIKGTSYPELLVPEYRDQIILRMIEPGCRDCIKAGECIHCGCPSPELFYDKDNSCAGENWGPMFEPDTWREIGMKMDPFYVEQLERKGVITKFK